jgi:flagellin-like protein
MRKAKVVWHKDDDAVSPVIGTILMVAITVVLAAVLWLMVSGMISTDDSDKTTVTLASPSVTSESRTNPCWDVTLNVQKITPKDDKVKWTELRIIIKGADGSVLNQASTPALNDPVGTPYNDPAGLLTTQVQFWYVEVTAGDDKLDAGDGIKITGMGTAYEGAYIEFTKGGERIASSTLPTNFP